MCSISFWYNLQLQSQSTALYPIHSFLSKLIHLSQSARIQQRCVLIMHILFLNNLNTVRVYNCLRFIWKSCQKTRSANKFIFAIPCSQTSSIGILEFIVRSLFMMKLFFMLFVHLMWKHLILTEYIFFLLHSSFLIWYAFSPFYFYLSIIHLIRKFFLFQMARGNTKKGVQ